ncbi:MAG TPA: hypothetical protein VN692_03670 [Steroidobacteraceae bacterium]|nr:hypothetical protein [Steroidobacteraceae bacterium]
MKPSDAADLELLESLARRAMLERGMLPEFSAAAPRSARVAEGFTGLEVGDPCRVNLIHTDVERGFIDLERVH